MSMPPPPHDQEPIAVPPPLLDRPAPKKVWWRRTWVIALAAGVVGLGIGGASAGGSNSTASADAKQTVVRTVAGKPGATLTTTTTVTATKIVKDRTIPTRTVQVRVVYTPPVKVAFTDGTFEVGKEVAPGIYKTDGQGDGIGCYWARLNSFNTSDIADNGNITGPTTIQIMTTDKAIEASGGCSWHRAG